MVGRDRSAPARIWTRHLAPRLARRARRGRGRVGLLAVLLLTSLLSPLAGAGVGLGGRAAHAQGINTGTPNLFDPATDTTSVIHLPAVPSGPTTSTGPAQPITHGGPPPMQPGSVALSATGPARFIGSDGALEVDVPAGAVSAADLAAAGGTLRLQATQLTPAAGSSAGGSGLIASGTYLLQVIDGQGHVVGRGLRRPVTARLHEGARGGGATWRTPCWW